MAQKQKRSKRSSKRTSRLGSVIGQWTKVKSSRKGKARRASRPVVADLIIPEPMAAVPSREKRRRRH